MTNLTEENRALRRELQRLKDEARHNQAVMDRFLAREMALLAAESLPELLCAATDGLRESFSLEAVTLLLLDPLHEIRHLLLHSGLTPRAFANVRFLDTDQGVPRLQRPRLGPYNSDLHATAFSPDRTLGSIALLPLIRHREHRGCLALGSSSPMRFTRHHASDFLQRLANVAALCLDNAVNREQLVLSGLTDPLTGLHNRRFLERKLREEVERAARYRQPLSCLFVDADHFKQVNDRFGHQTGDNALRELADCVRSQLRVSDIATRYGGEELALLLPHTDPRQARLLAERIRMAVEQIRVASDCGETFPLTVSIGSSTLLPPPRARDAAALGERLLTEADQALYQAKALGRNRVVTWPEPRQSDLHAIEGAGT